MTTDLLKEQHDNLKYFKDDLSGVNEAIDWVEVRDNPQIMIEFINELIYINRINTISREKEWRKAHSYSPFKAQLFKQRCINNRDANEWQEIKGWGSNFKDEEEWNVYSEWHDKLFIFEE